MRAGLSGYFAKARAVVVNTLALTKQATGDARRRYSVVETGTVASR